MKGKPQYLLTCGWFFHLPSAGGSGLSRYSRRGLPLQHFHDRAPLDVEVQRLLWAPSGTPQPLVRSTAEPTRSFSCMYLWHHSFSQRPGTNHGPWDRSRPLLTTESPVGFAWLLLQSAQWWPPASLLTGSELYVHENWTIFKICITPA